MLVHARYTVTRCPACRSGVDVNFFSLTTLLGPPTVLCHWCGKPVAVHRLEWKALRVVGKLWFTAVSLFYLALIAGVGGQFVDMAVERWHTGHTTPGWHFTTPAFAGGAVFYAGLVLVVQIHRIQCSIARSRQAVPEPVRSLRSLQIAMQFKFLILILIPVAATWAMKWFGTPQAP